MSYESTDLHRARVGAATSAVLIALVLGLFPANEAVYLVAGHSAGATVTAEGPHYSRWRRMRGPRHRVVYTYRDAAGREHHDSSVVSRSHPTPHAAGKLPIQYHAFPWRSSRASGVDWVGLILFGVAAVVAAGLVVLHRHDLHQFWRRERDMAGF